MTPEEGAQRVTIWNRFERRKLAGNAAPLRRNLQIYLSENPDWEEYTGQDGSLDDLLAVDPVNGLFVFVQNEKVPVWNRHLKKKITGNAAPRRKNLERFFENNPQCELYCQQDKDQPPSAPAHPALGMQAPRFEPVSVRESLPAEMSATNAVNFGMLRPSANHFAPKVPTLTSADAASPVVFKAYNSSAFTHQLLTQDVPPPPPPHLHKIARPDDLPYSESMSSWANYPTFASVVNAPTPDASEASAAAAIERLMDTGEVAVPGALTRNCVDEDPCSEAMVLSFGSDMETDFPMSERGIGGDSLLSFDGSLLGAEERALDSVFPDAADFSPSKHRAYSRQDSGT